MKILKMNFAILSITLSIAGCGKNTNTPTVEPILSEGLPLTDPSSELTGKGKPLALIYKGPGSCSLADDDAGESGYGCSEAAADVAKAAGFDYRFVGPKDLPENATSAQVQAFFKGARLWVQPGGIAQRALYSMTYKLRKELVNFISSGGGYVGFCAGAFIATSYIGNSGDPGLGIFPGRTMGYSYSSENGNVGYSFEKMKWDGAPRSIFFEGGPYLYGYGKKAEATAVFDTGYTSAARASYGVGRVYITGGHPEAPAIWSEEDDLHDPDGNDYEIGARMYRWAASLE